MSFEQLLKDLSETARAERSLLRDFSWTVCHWILAYLHHHPAKRTDPLYDFLYTYTLNELIAAECRLPGMPQATLTATEARAAILSHANELSPKQTEKYAPAVNWAISLLKQFEKTR